MYQSCGDNFVVDGKKSVEKINGSKPKMDKISIFISKLKGTGIDHLRGTP